MNLNTDPTTFPEDVQGAAGGGGVVFDEQKT
jgi:hypothetical protein